MGLFDKGFNLPGINKAASTITSSVTSTVSFGISSATTKVSEAVSTTLNSLGSFSPFTKLGAGLPTIESLKAAALRSGSTLDGTNQLVNEQIANEQESLLAQGSASSVKAATGVKSVSADHLVSLSDGSIIVEFEVMPEIVEQRTAGYEAVAPAQAPGAFQKYKGTDSTVWTLNIMFISRNSEEATQNLKKLNALRAWMLPFFGATTGRNFPKKLGAPPAVLTLKGLRGLIGPVPVVITSLNWTWPRDVDYLPTFLPGSDGNWIPFPAVLSVPIQLVESYSTTQFNQFDLRAFWDGDMRGAFNIPVVDYSNENYDSRGLALSTAATRPAPGEPPPIIPKPVKIIQKQTSPPVLNGKGVVSEGANVFTLGPRLAADAKKAREEGLKILAEASAANAATRNTDRPKGGR